ncbi:MAG: hypothetical protein ACJA04_000533 [Cellvibrionaceae bacterium]|jgi:hypothetical protein
MDKQGVNRDSVPHIFSDGLVTMADSYLNSGLGKQQYIFSFADVALPGEHDSVAGENAPLDLAEYAG